MNPQDVISVKLWLFELSGSGTFGVLAVLLACGVVDWRAISQAELAAP